MPDTMENDRFSEWMRCCTLCPRECGADRQIGRRGVCGAGAEVMVARAALHAWEEPVISGTRGSGAVFFSGCSLGCIYCQNAEISRVPGSGPGPGNGADEASKGSGRTLPGVEVSIAHLAEIFLKLQDQEKAHNINLVTPTHYIPQIAAALVKAKEDGLRIPVIYNTSGYEKVSSLKLLDGLVDVYLPDFKYRTPALAQQYSHAADYPDRAAKALEEMVRQTGETRFYTEDGSDEGTLIGSGVIVRHLLLPGHVEESRKVVRYLHETYGDGIWISLMNQYTPMAAVQGDPLLRRKVTKREYDRLVDYAIGIGVKNGFIQEGKTAEESFIPSWNGEGCGEGAD